MAERQRCDQNESMSAWMSLALDGALDSALREKLDRHLEDCPTCRVQWSAMQRTSALLERAPMVGPPLGFAIRIERRLAERAEKRRRMFGSAAVWASSLSLAGVALTSVFVVVMGLVAWQWLGEQPAFQQGGDAVMQVASGVSLMGKGASYFLKDLLLRYGLPVMLMLGVAVVVLGGLWAWLFWRQAKAQRNGLA